MAFFVGAGTIADDIVRKETRNGVLATFRLETGAPNNRAPLDRRRSLGPPRRHHRPPRHRPARAVLVAGRLTQKTWRDRDTGEARHRYVVTALDIDLLPDDTDPILLPTTVVAAGTVETVYPDRPTNVRRRALLPPRHRPSRRQDRPPLDRRRALDLELEPLAAWWSATPSLGPVTSPTPSGEETTALACSTRVLSLRARHVRTRPRLSRASRNPLGPTTHRRRLEPCVLRMCQRRRIALEAVT